MFVVQLRKRQSLTFDTTPRPRERTTATECSSISVADLSTTLFQLNRTAVWQLVDPDAYTRLRSRWFTLLSKRLAKTHALRFATSAR